MNLLQACCESETILFASVWDIDHALATSSAPCALVYGMVALVMHLSLDFTTTTIGPFYLQLAESV